MNITAGISIFTGIVLSTTVAHSAVVTYAFSGAVSDLNPGSNSFSGVGIGTSVSGLFSIDYCAINSGGSYSSSESTLVMEIGTHNISSSSATIATINVDNSFPDQDFVVFEASPQDPNQPITINFTFFDPTGETLTSEQLPASAAELNAYPSVVLFVETIPGFGFYNLDVTFEAVIPEPSSSILLLSGVAYLAMRRKRLS